MTLLRAGPLLCAAALLLAADPCPAQSARPTAAPATQALSALPQPGPFAVGWRNEVLPFVGTSTIKDRFYYPAVAPGLDADADLSSGPYPLVALIHGSTGAPKDYDILSSHLASHGYVIASLGKMSALHETFSNMATETVEMIDWIVTASEDPTSPYAGLVADGDIGVIGNSRGGGAAQLVIGLEPRVTAVVAMEPRYHPSVASHANMAAWDGTWLFITGELDTIVPPAEVQQILSLATGSPRRFYVELLGAGHAGAVDPDTVGLPSDPMPHEQQLSLHARMALSAFEAVLGKDEDHVHDLLGHGLADEPLIRESHCIDPPLWAVEASDPAAQVAFGLAGGAGDTALLALSLGVAAVPTQYGTLGLDPAQALFLPATLLDGQGMHELVLTAPAGATGLELHLQGLLKPTGGGGTLTRTDLVIVP